MSCSVESSNPLAESWDAENRVVGGDSITGESVAADATVRDAANRAVGGDSITGESVAADATVREGAFVGSNAEAVAGNGAFWLDAKAEAVAGNGAFWEEDARRSPIMAFDLELESAPMGRGEQPTNPAYNATSANGLPKREPCDMASSAAVNTRFVAKLVAQIAVLELLQNRRCGHTSSRYCSLRLPWPAANRLDRCRCPATPVSCPRSSRANWTGVLLVA